ncbi:MAG: hypothetical protein ACFFAO_03265 [Candidatus Hermodarchaeota archaeon]
MTLTQISVQLVDKPGELLKFTKMLHNNNITIISITVSQVPGLCLFIVDKTEDCIKLLKQQNYDISSKEVIGVLLPHNPSSSEEIEKVAEILGENEVNIDFLYSTFVKKTNILVIHISDIEKASQALKSKGVYLFKED